MGGWCVCVCVFVCNTVAMLPFTLLGWHCDVDLCHCASTASFEGHRQNGHTPAQSIPPQHDVGSLGGKQQQTNKNSNLIFLLLFGGIDPKLLIHRPRRLWHFFFKGQFLKVNGNKQSTLILLLSSRKILNNLRLATSPLRGPQQWFDFQK